MSSASQDDSAPPKPDQCPRNEPKDLPPEASRPKRGSISKHTGWMDPVTRIRWCTYPSCLYHKDTEKTNRAVKDINEHYRRLHCMRKQGRKLLLCEYCDQLTKTAPDMKKHVKSIHTFGETLEECTNHCSRAWFFEVKNAWRHTRDYCPQRKMEPRPKDLYNRNWSIEKKAFIPVPQKSPRAAPTSNKSSYNFNDPPTSTVSPLRTEPVPSQSLSRLPPGQYSFSVAPSQHNETSNNRDAASDGNWATNFVDSSHLNNDHLGGYAQATPSLSSHSCYSQDQFEPSLSFEHNPQTPSFFLFPPAAPSAVNPHQHFSISTHFQHFGNDFHPLTQAHFDSHDFASASPSNFDSVNSAFAPSSYAFQPTKRQTPLPLNAVFHKPIHEPPSDSFGTQTPLQFDYPSSNIPDLQPNYAISGFMTPSHNSQYLPLTPQSAHHSNSSPWPVVVRNSPYDQYQHLPVDSSPLTYYHQYHQM